jgi:hypothetical protein
VADTTIRISANAADAQREFAAIDRAIDRIGTSALATGERLQRAFAQMGRSARQAAADMRQASAGGGASGGGGLNQGDIFFGSLKANVVAEGLGAVTTAVGAVSNEMLELSRANVALATSARESGRTLGEQQISAGKLAEALNISRSAAAQLTAQTTSLAVAAGIGADKADDLAVALANALAARGRSLSEIPDRVRQLATGQDELFDVLGPVNIGGRTAASPEAIYKATAAQMGLNRELTDTEKLQARINAVMLKGAEAQGAAASSAQTLAGQWEYFKNDLVKNLTDQVVTLAWAFGIAADAQSAGVGGAAIAAERSRAYTAERDAFQRGLGTAEFANIGREGPATAEQQKRFSSWAEQEVALYLEDRDRQREFERQQANALPGRIRALEGQRESLRQSIAQGAFGIADLEARRAALAGPETAEALRRRIFGTADEFARDYGAREAAQYTISALGRYDPARLSQEARDRLKGAYDTEIAESKKEIAERKAQLARMDANLAALRNKLVGSEEFDPDEVPVTQIVIENRDPTAVARFGSVTLDGEEVEY